MKRRILSIMLTICMVLSLVPNVVLADDGQKPWESDPTSWTKLTKAYLESVDYKIAGGCYYLDDDVTLDKTLVVTGASKDDPNVTLDLNGNVLKYDGSTNGSVIEVYTVSVSIHEDAGILTYNYPTYFIIRDSAPSTEHKFTVGSDGLWTLDETSGTKCISGGVITGGTGRELNGSSNKGGGIFIVGNGAAQVTVEMTGGSIVGCTANSGGGVVMLQYSSFTMSGNAQICGCTATEFEVVDNIYYHGYGGGIYNNVGTLTLKDNARIAECVSSDASSCAIDSAGTIYADGGEIHGTVFSGNYNHEKSKITTNGTTTADVTKFYDTVTNKNSVIEGGIFYGTVTNKVFYSSDDPENLETLYGTITGGTFYADITSDDSNFTKYIVTFQRNDGTEDAYATLYVVSGNKVTRLADPTREGYNFVNWYTDKNCTSVFDFNKAVTATTTLYAKWECAGHTGGTATCKNKAVCTTCGDEYGDLDPDNHEGVKEWSTKNATQHEQTWNCCGVVVVSLENHEWENGVCTECEYPCQHTGGTATCVNKAVCEICGEEYGDLDPENHEGEEGWSITPNKHEQIWDCCGEIIVALENHEWENGICTECEIPCLHDYQWQNENGQYWQKCQICGLETSKSDVPNPEISGNDTICQGHDWTFTFTLPEGSTDVTYGYNFEYKGTGDLIPTCENGVYTITIPADLIDGEISFKLNIYATTADGFAFSSTKEVAIISDHEGGTATCVNKAVCEICGDEYGEFDATNHVGEKEWSTKNETQHEEKFNCCDEITVALENHEWENGTCTECGYACQHVGGEASCKSKALCENCGEEYGEINPLKHAMLKHIEGVDATYEKDGNSEYWYCEDCDKYFSDENGEFEISLADTVITKLEKPADKDDVPNTGDNHTLLWIALFIATGGFTKLIINDKKKSK